jgi:hypothetical protein
MAVCKDITVEVGTANITVLASALNNGSSDNCSPASALTYAICRVVSPATACTNFAASLSLAQSLIPTGATFVILPVTLRVTDACGNISLCNANIRLKKTGTLAGNKSEQNSIEEVATEAVTPTVPSDIDATHGSMKCFPNPFSDDLNIDYNLASDVSKLVIKVYDNQGRLVKTNDQGESLAGYYNMRWNLSDLPSGLYHVCLEANDKCLKVERVILAK